MLYKREGSPVFSKKKKVHPCVFALQNILHFYEKISIWTSVTSENNIIFKVWFRKKVLWLPNYSNKHLSSPNKHTFHGNVSFLVKRFRTTKFFRPKNKSWVSHLQTAEKHGESSVRFWFGAAPLPLCGELSDRRTSKYDLRVENMLLFVVLLVFKNINL